MSPTRRYLRRTLQVVALVGTLLVGIAALALIVSQTPWFRDWLRKYAVRQAGQYVNGTVSIGSLSGDLFYGIELGDVAIDVNGEHVVTLKHAEVKYSIGELVGKGITVREIHLDQPVVHLVHDGSGWNLSRLIKKQAAGGRPHGSREVGLAAGRRDRPRPADDRRSCPFGQLPAAVPRGGPGCQGRVRVPPRCTTASRSITSASRARRLTSPCRACRGGIAARGDDLHVDSLSLKTPQSSLTIDGVVRNYLSSPSLQVTLTAPKMSLPEFGRVLPAVQGYDLHPALDRQGEPDPSTR